MKRTNYFNKILLVGLVSATLASSDVCAMGYFSKGWSFAKNAWSTISEKSAPIINSDVVKNFVGVVKANQRTSGLIAAGTLLGTYTFYRGYKGVKNILRRRADRFVQQEEAAINEVKNQAQQISTNLSSAADVIDVRTAQKTPIDLICDILKKYKNKKWAQDLSKILSERFIFGLQSYSLAGFYNAYMKILDIEDKEVIESYLSDARIIFNCKIKNINLCCNWALLELNKPVK